MIFIKGLDDHTQYKDSIDPSTYVSGCKEITTYKFGPYQF